MALAPRPRPRTSQPRRRRAGRPFVAFTRARKIQSAQYLVEQGEHARREDATGAARVRLDAIPGTSLGWSILDSDLPVPRPVHDTHYNKALEVHLTRNKARRRGTCALGLHLQVNVPAELIEEGGDLHDPANPRTHKLFKTTVDWIHKTFGPALFALRIDLDETGGGVVDAFLAPLRHLGQKGKHYAQGAGGPLWISVNRAMEELTTRFGHRKSENWGAINTSWAAYAREHLDPRLVRGEPKRHSGRKHIPIDQIRQTHEAFDAWEADLKHLKDDLRRKKAALARVMAATLAGRIRPDAGGEPVVQPGWTAFCGGRSKTVEDDASLLRDLQLVERTSGVAIRTAMAFVRRLLRLDGWPAEPAWSAPPEDDGTVTDSRAATQADPDDAFALPDPTAMTPRPW